MLQKHIFQWDFCWILRHSPVDIITLLSSQIVQFSKRFYDIYCYTSFLRCKISILLFPLENRLYLHHSPSLWTPWLHIFPRAFFCHLNNPPADGSASLGFTVIGDCTFPLTSTSTTPFLCPDNSLPFLLMHFTQLAVLGWMSTVMNVLATPLPKFFLLQFKQPSLGVPASLGLLPHIRHLVYPLPPCATTSPFL